MVELVRTGGDLVTIYTTDADKLNPATLNSKLFQGAAATAGNPEAAASFDRQLVFGVTTLGVGPLVQSGYNAVITGDSTEFSQQAGGFGVMVLVPYAGGRGWAYIRGPRFAVETPPPGAVPELPAQLPRLPNGQTALPAVEIPPELLPVTDSMFRTLYNEVTANPPPVRRLQVIEGVQGGTDGAPSTAVSGQPAVVDIPGINTAPLPNAPVGTPPPGVCGVPRALGGGGGRGRGAAGGADLDGVGRVPAAERSWGRAEGGTAGD